MLENARHAALFLLLLLLIGGLGCVNGKIAQYMEDNTVSVSNTTVMQSKLDLEFISNEADSFFIQWTAEVHAGHEDAVVSNDTTTTTAPSAVFHADVTVCLIFNNVIQNEQRWHPDTNGNDGGWSVVTGFFLAPTIVGVNGVNITFSSTIDGEGVSRRRARIMMIPTNA